MGDHHQQQSQNNMQHNAGASYVGAQVAQSALERRITKNNQRARETEPLQPLANGIDGKKYRNLTAQLSIFKTRLPLISLVCRIRTFFSCSRPITICL